MQTWFLRSLLLCVLLCVATGCSSAEEKHAVEWHKGVQVGPRGGEVDHRSEHGHARIKVPSGGLEHNLVMEIEPWLEVPPGATGPAYEVSPSGTTFGKPAKIVLPKPKSSGILQNEWRVAVYEEERWKVLDSAEDKDGVGGWTTHLSLFAVVDSGAGEPFLLAEQEGREFLAGPLRMKTSTDIRLMSMHVSQSSISYLLEPIGTEEEATITLEGLRPHARVFVYDGGFSQKTEFTANASGHLDYVQSLAGGLHYVFIQEWSSTIKIDATGGDCLVRTDVAIWDSGSSTCTLTGDLSESVEISGAGVTLDCASHTIATGGPTAVVVAQNAAQAVVKNCELSSVAPTVIIAPNAAGSRLENNQIHVTVHGGHA